MLWSSMKEEQISTWENKQTKCQSMKGLMKKKNYLPLRELSTAFSINSIIVCDLNLAHEPKENVPESNNWNSFLKISCS